MSLERKIQSLEDKCTWTNHFERQLDRAKFLLLNDFTQDDLNDLSHSIRSVYGGMCSFTDYYNPNYTKQRNHLIKNIGSSTDIAAQVYECAINLKVTHKSS